MKINTEEVDISKDGKYRKGIINLWHTVFGDDEEYICRFIDECQGKICISAFVDGEPAAMMFLIDSSYNGHKGAYVYAVATNPEYRRKGLMASILKYAADLEFDFLWLVPAEEYLFDVYAKYGYLPLLKKRVYDNNLLESESKQSAKSISQYLDCSDFNKSNCICIDDMEYVFSESAFADGGFYISGNKCFAVRNGDVIDAAFSSSVGENISGMIRFKQNCNFESAYINFVLD